MSHKNTFGVLRLCRRLLPLALLLGLCTVLPQQTDGRPAYEEETVVSTATFYQGRQTNKILENARKAEEAGEMQRAALLYQETIESALKEGGVMTPVELDEFSRTERFMPVADFCCERLRGMGEEIRERYLVTCEPTAARLYERALARKDMELMLDTAKRYPLCESALKARAFLADIAAENASFARAASLYAEALETRLAYSLKTPALRGETAVLAAKYASVLASLGRVDETAALAERIKNKGLGNERVNLRGKTVALSQALAEAHAAAQKAAPDNGDPASTDHAMLGGSPARDMLMPGPSGMPGATVWNDYLANNERTFFVRENEMPLSMYARLISPMPVCSDDTIYLNTGKALLALDAYTGARKFKFLPPSQVKYNSSRYLPPMETCSVADGILYAAMPTEGGSGTEIIRHLYAFDIRSATSDGNIKPLWCSHVETGLKSTVESVSGDVVVRNGEAFFVVARNMSGDTPIALVCADARTGRMKWQCDLVDKIGAPTYNSGAQDADIVTIHQDTAIIATSAGAVVAVDLATQTIKWGLRYHMHYGYSNRTFYRNDTALPHTWSPTRPILHDGKLVYIPRKSKTMFCLDVETGRVLWSNLREDNIFGNFLQIVGVRDNLVYYVDDIYRPETFIYQGRWVEPPKRAARDLLPPRLRAVDINTGKDVMYCDLVSPDRRNLTPIGRPAMTESAIYIPTTTSLVMYDLAAGELRKVFDWNDRGMFAGNLLQTQLGMVVANAANVLLLADPRAPENLTARAAETKTARGLLRAGKLHMAYGEPAKALDSLKLAAKLSRPDEILNDESLPAVINGNIIRARMLLAEQAQKNGDNDEAIRQMHAVLESDAPADLRAVCQVRLATLEIASDDPATRKAAVEYFQQVIIEAPDIAIQIDETLSESVGYYAARQLRAALGRLGREPYAAHEKRAEAALAAAEKSDSLDDYVTVYRHYPNSLAAQRALAGIAKHYEKTGNKSMALTAMKAACENLVKDADGAEALALAARLAADCADVEAAEALLERLGALPAETKLRIGEEEIAIAKFIETQTARMSSKVADKIPTGLKKARSLNLDEITGSDRGHATHAILEPEGPRPASMEGKMLARKNGIIACYDLTDGNLLWTNGPERAWLGFEVMGGGALLTIRMPEKAVKNGIRNLDRLNKINGVEIREVREFWEMLAKIKAGEQVKVEYYESSTGTLKQAVIRAATMPGDYSSAPSNMWFNGDGDLVIQVSHLQAEWRCIDIETGATKWFRSVQANRIYGDRIEREVCGGMLTFITYANSRLHFKALDLNTGEITDLLLDTDPTYHREITPMGSAVVVAEIYENKCGIYDAITGALRLTIEIPGNDVIDYRLGGDRLVVAESRVSIASRPPLRLYIIDVAEGRVIYHANAAWTLIRLPQQTAHEILVPAQRETKAMLFDTRGVRPPRTIALGTVPFFAFFHGTTLCCVAQDRRTISAFDIPTGRCLWTRNLQISEIGELHFSGDYLIYCHKVQHAPGTGQPANPQQNFGVELRLIDPTTGADVFVYDPKEPIGLIYAIKAVIVGRRLCLIVNNEIKVWE